MPWRLNVSVELVTIFKGGCEIKGVSLDYSDLTCDFFSLFKKNKPKCKYMDLHNFYIDKTLRHTLDDLEKKGPLGVNN